MKKTYSEPCLPLALYRMPFRMSQYKLLVYRWLTTAVASTLRHHHGLYRCIFDRELIANFANARKT